MKVDWMKERSMIEREAVGVSDNPEYDRSEQIGNVADLHRRVNRRLRLYVPEAWLDLNLTIAQLKSLFFIANQGSTNSRRLAAALGVTPSNVTGIVDRLVEQGLVSRQENPEDRRSLLLQATDKGESILSDLRERRTTYLSEVLARLSQEELSLVESGLSLLARAADECEGN